MSGTECYSAAEGGSRKRIKTSKTARRDVSNGPASPILIPSDTPMKSESGPSEGVLLSKAEQQQQHHSHTHNGTCHHEQSLRSLHLEMDAMRQLITCKMCYRFLYEPYGLVCGHTYCYSCLATWMMKSKTCPDCRAKVKEQPTPTFVIREMVRVFAAKSELLPDGETSEEHEQMAKEEAEIVAKDRANEDVEKGGLFHGRFRKGSRYHPVPAMRDDSDNVWRCPSCMNEVEDGRCGICRIRVRVDGETDDDSTLSDDDDELDGALEDMDYDHDVDLGLHAGVDFGFDGFVDRSSDIDDGPHFYDDNVDMLGFSDSDSDDSEGSMDGFIDEEVHFEDDATVDETEDEAETIRARPSGAQHRRRPVLSDSDSGSDTGGDDDDDDAEEDDRPRSVIPTHRNFDGASSAGASRNTDDEEEDSEEEPISLHSQRSRRRQRAITIDSDDEGQSSDVPPEEGQVDFSNFQAFSPASVRTDDSGAVHLVSDEEDIVNGFAGYGSPDDTQEENGYPTSGEEDDDGPAPLNDTDDDDEEDDEANEGEQESDNSDEQSFMSELGRGSCSHRLHTLGPRRNRHRSPPPTYSSLYPQGNPHVQPTYRMSRIPAVVVARAARAAHPRRPTTLQSRHPFQLSSTLARLNAEHQNPTGRSAYSADGAAWHGAPYADSEDEAEIAQYTSGWSGTSRTLEGRTQPAAERSIRQGRGRTRALLDHASESQ